MSFRLHYKNTFMPPLAEFFSPLDVVDATLESRLAPHFLVVTQSPAVLHHDSKGRFSSTILKLLQRNYSVHLKLTDLREHGLPQDRGLLLLVAALPSVVLDWQASWPLPGSRLSHPVEDLISDLNFSNPRVSAGTNSGFVCSWPLDPDTQDPLTFDGARLLYNHQTGRMGGTGMQPLNLDADNICLSPYLGINVLHPRKIPLRYFKLVLCTPDHTNTPC